MEWKYKETTISVNSNGIFTFRIKGDEYRRTTLAAAKNEIDRLTREYYTITDEDIDSILNSLNPRQRSFIEDLLGEMSAHIHRGCCTMGNGMNFDFSCTSYFD